MTPALAWSLIALSVLLNAFFAGVETGFTSARRIRLLHRARNGSRTAGLAALLLRRRENMIIAAVVGNNVAVVAGTAVATSAFVAWYGGAGETWAAVVMSALNIVFGEILPKALYRSHPELLLSASAGPFWLMSRVLLPLQWFALVLSRGLLTLLGQGTESGVPRLSRERLLRIFRMSRERGEVGEGEDALIHRFVNASRLPLTHVLTPVEQVATLSAGSTAGDALALVHDTGHSRLPVRHADGELGSLVLFRDLMDADPGDTLERYHRSLLYLPERMGLDEAIAALTTAQLSLAAVVDAEGHSVGIVTLEDLLEPLVGDILDEHDRPAVLV